MKCCYLKKQQDINGELGEIWGELPLIPPPPCHFERLRVDALAGMHPFLSFRARPRNLEIYNHAQPILHIHPREQKRHNTVHRCDKRSGKACDRTQVGNNPGLYAEVQLP